MGLMIKRQLAASRMLLGHLLLVGLLLLASSAHAQKEIEITVTINKKQQKYTVISKALDPSKAADVQVLK